MLVLALEMLVLALDVAAAWGPGCGCIEAIATNRGPAEARPAAPVEFAQVHVKGRPPVGLVRVERHNAQHRPLLDVEQIGGLEGEEGTQPLAGAKGGSRVS